MFVFKNVNFNKLFTGTLTQAIRNFSKSLESWLISAMQGCPEEMISIKVLFFIAFLFNHLLLLL